MYVAFQILSLIKYMFYVDIKILTVSFVVDSKYFFVVRLDTS